MTIQLTIDQTQVQAQEGQTILQAAREARIAERVPPLCDALCASGLSKRMAFQIAGLVLGRDPNHVLRLYYARRHA